MQVDSAAVKQACPVPFDEGRLWKGEDGPELKRQLQAHFHNITKAMDCVGCEKCKLWGKLQLLGMLSLCCGWGNNAYPQPISPGQRHDMA